MDMYEPGHENDHAFDNYDQWLTTEPEQEEEPEAYLLFAGKDYYPMGGIGDFQGVFNSIEEAHAFASGGAYDWVHVAIFRDRHFIVVAQGQHLGTLYASWYEIHADQ